MGIRKLFDEKENGYHTWILGMKTAVRGKNKIRFFRISPLTMCNTTWITSSINKKTKQILRANQLRPSYIKWCYVKFRPGRLPLYNRLYNFLEISWVDSLRCCLHNFLFGISFGPELGHWKLLNATTKLNQGKHISKK